MEEGVRLHRPTGLNRRRLVVSLAVVALSLAVVEDLDAAPEVVAGPVRVGEVGIPLASTNLRPANASAPLTYRIVSGHLPHGTSLAPATGAFTGAPKGKGSYSFVEEVEDSTGARALERYSFVIAGPPACSKVARGVGELGVSLSFKTCSPYYRSWYSKAKSFLPATYRVTSGSLPPGLSLGGDDASAAQLDGAPTQLGTYRFEITATDVLGGTARGSYTLSIYPKLTLAPGSGALPAGQVDTAYSTTVSASGGKPPFAYMVTDSTGEPPAIDETPSTAVSDDLELNPSTGTISGTPTFDEVRRTVCTAPSTTLSFTVTVTDTTGFTAEERYTLSIPGPKEAALTPLEAHTICGAPPLVVPQPTTVSGALFAKVPIAQILRFGRRPGFVTPVWISLTGPVTTPTAVEFGGVNVPFVLLSPLYAFSPPTIATVLPVGVDVARGATVKTRTGTITIQWFVPAG